MHDEAKPPRTSLSQIVNAAIGCAAVMIPLSVALIQWGGSVESRLAGHTAEITAMQAVDARQDRDRDVERASRDRRLERIENKLDALIDSRVNGGVGLRR